MTARGQARHLRLMDTTLSVGMGSPSVPSLCTLYWPCKAIIEDVVKGAKSLTAGLLKNEPAVSHFPGLILVPFTSRRPANHAASHGRLK